MKKKALKMSPPWASFYSEIEALFGEDPDIELEYDEDGPEILLYVNNSDKADALTQILPTEKVFGRIVLKVTVVPANREVSGPEDLFQRAFEGNPVFSHISKSEDSFAYQFSYVVFKKKVVQFFDDNLGDYKGNRSTLYQNIAADVFDGNKGVFFCTDTEDE